jgi:hypothetical protein
VDDSDAEEHMRERIAAVRRHCVSHTRLYTTVGGSIAVSAVVMFGAITLHAWGEATAREALERRDGDRIEAIGKRLDDLGGAVRDGLAELRQDVKTLLRR